MRAVILAALTIIALALLPFVVQAQTVNVNDISAAYGSIGTSAAVCVPAGTGAFTRNQITLANSSASATISVGYNASITVNGQGTVTVAPGQTAYWPRGQAPGGEVYCVASQSATPAQIALGQ
jgi:hypothetical protein